MSVHHLHVRPTKGKFLINFKVFALRLWTYIFHFGLWQGLMLAIQELWPEAEHRFCMRHLYTNFRKKIGWEEIKEFNVAGCCKYISPSLGKRDEKYQRSQSWDLQIPHSHSTKVFFILHIDNTIIHYDDANICVTHSFSDFGPDLGSQIKPSVTLW